MGVIMSISRGIKHTYMPKFKREYRYFISYKVDGNRFETQDVTIDYKIKSSKDVLRLQADIGDNCIILSFNRWRLQHGKKEH